MTHERDVGRHILLGQTRECDDLRDGLTYENGQRGGDLGRHGVDAPVRAEDQDTHRRKLARDELQEEQRRCVGRVEIVEEEDGRALLGCGSQEGRHGVEEPESRSVGPDAARLPSCRKQLAQLGCVRVAVADVGAQRLHPGPVRRRAARLPGAPDENGHTAAPGEAQEFVGEEALADAWLALQQHEPTTTGECIFERPS